MLRAIMSYVGIQLQLKRAVAHAVIASALMVMLILLVGCASGSDSSVASVIDTVPSPDGSMVAIWYRYDYGSLGYSHCDYVAVVPADGSEPERDLWCGPRLYGDSPLVWVGDKTLYVGEQYLAVGSSAFDWWDDRLPDGLPSSEDAARLYATGFVRNDIDAVRMASWQLVTPDAMAAERAWRELDAILEIKSTAVSVVPPHLLSVAYGVSDDDGYEVSEFDDSIGLAVTVSYTQEGKPDLCKEEFYVTCVSVRDGFWPFNRVWPYSKFCKVKWHVNDEHIGFSEP